MRRWRGSMGWRRRPNRRARRPHAPAGGCGRGRLGRSPRSRLVALVGIPMARDHRDVPSEVARQQPKGDARPERMVADRTTPAPPIRREGRTDAHPLRTGTPRATERQEEAVPPPPPVPAPVFRPAPVSAFAPAPVPKPWWNLRRRLHRRPRPPRPRPDVRPGSGAGRRGYGIACRTPHRRRSLHGTRLRHCRRARGYGLARRPRRAGGWRFHRAAIGALDRAIALRPDLASAYLNRALAYRQRGDLARAEKDMDRAIRLDRSARAYRLRSDIRTARGDAKGAQKDRERADRLEADGAGDRRFPRDLVFAPASPKAPACPVFLSSRSSAVPMSASRRCSTASSARNSRWSTIGRRDARPARGRCDADRHGLPRRRQPPATRITDAQTLPGRMRLQTEAAIGQADVALFLVDARAGVVPLDEEIARWLRSSSPPSCSPPTGRGEGRRTGRARSTGAGLRRSGAAVRRTWRGHGRPVRGAASPSGSRDRGDAGGRGRRLPDAPLKLAIVGRPNAGKSTLINKMLGEDRMITGRKPASPAIRSRSTGRGTTATTFPARSG